MASRELRMASRELRMASRELRMAFRGLGMGSRDLWMAFIAPGFMLQVLGGYFEESGHSFWYHDGSSLAA
jgi:hypothetical protein